MKTMITSLLIIVLGLSALASNVEESPQVAATRNINKLLVDGKFEEVYRDWCHPHIQEQVEEKEFIESMKEESGKGIIKLFADVIKVIDDKAGPDVIIAQPQEDIDEYEFILTKVKENNNPFSDKRNPWHIELKLHDGKWKLMDTD